MSITQLRIVVLYADVSGSTHIYERFGDTVALADITACLELMSEVAEKYKGKIIKTIGDEVMFSFNKPAKAAEAAIEMHQALEDASEEGRFQSGDLHIKIGWHYGRGLTRKDDITGEAPTLAQQVIKMAKADEILTTKKSIDELPDVLKCTAYFIDSIEAEDGSGNIDVFALPWEEDRTEATMAMDNVSGTHEVTGSLVHEKLILRYGGKKYEMNAQNSSCQIGRGEDNDVVVQGEFTSRHHGDIYYRHGRFHLCDMSTNGTGVIQDGNNFERLHREEKILSGSGKIYFGGSPETDPKAAVSYKCIETTDEGK